MNPNITLEFVKKYPDNLWNWELLSKNDNISLEDVGKNPDYPWFWYAFSR